MGFFDQPKARMPTSRARMYQGALQPQAPGAQVNQQHVEQPGLQPGLPKFPGTPSAGPPHVMPGGADRSGYQSGSGVQSGQDNGPHTAEQADSGDYQSQYSGMWTQTQGTTGAALPRQTPIQQLKGSLGQIPGANGGRMISAPLRPQPTVSVSPGLSAAPMPPTVNPNEHVQQPSLGAGGPNQLGEGMAQARMFAQRQSSMQQAPAAGGGFSKWAQIGGGGGANPQSGGGVASSSSALTADSTGSTTTPSTSTGTPMTDALNQAHGAVQTVLEHKDAERQTDTANGLNTYYPGITPEDVAELEKMGYHFNPMTNDSDFGDHNTVVDSNGHALNLDDDGGRATFKSIVDSIRAERDKAAATKKDADEHDKYDQMMKDLMNQAPAQIDPNTVNGLVSADAKKRALEQSRAMMSAMQMGANADVSPEASQGQIADLQQQGGAQAAESAARIKMDAERQNLSGKIASNQQKAQALMAMAGWVKDSNQRQAMLQQAMALQKQAQEGQMELERYQHQLNSEISDKDWLSVGGGAAGTIIGSILGKKL